jgi:rSAM/selenodomain-associated transferase 1
METLVLFAKAPVLGAVKTRIAADRGEKDALALYTAFLLDIAEMAGAWRAERVAVDQNRRLAIYAAPDADDPILAEVARRSGARTETQVEGDQSTKLRACFEAEFQRGARTVCVIGADTPTLPVHMIDEAFRALLWERVVLGPTFDGGYWLVGSQRRAPEMFNDIPWATPAVLVRSLAKLRGLGIEPHLLPFWYDVDEVSDLERLAWHVRTLREPNPGILRATWRALVDLGLARDDGRDDSGVAPKAKEARA